MITIKEMTTYIRLLDLYGLDEGKYKKIFSYIKSQSINTWYIIGNNTIASYVDYRINKKIKETKEKINMSNKKSYLLAYKIGMNT